MLLRWHPDLEFESLYWSSLRCLFATWFIVESPPCDVLHVGMLDKVTVSVERSETNVDSSHEVFSVHGFVTRERP